MTVSGEIQRAPLGGRSPLGVLILKLTSHAGIVVQFAVQNLGVEVNIFLAGVQEAMENSLEFCFAIGVVAFVFLCLDAPLHRCSI